MGQTAGRLSGPPPPAPGSARASLTGHPADVEDVMRLGGVVGRCPCRQYPSLCRTVFGHLLRSSKSSRRYGEGQKSAARARTSAEQQLSKNELHSASPDITTSQRLQACGLPSACPNVTLTSKPSSRLWLNLALNPAAGHVGLLNRSLACPIPRHAGGSARGRAVSLVAAARAA